MARVYIVAAEPSGDLLARETLECLLRLQPDLEFAGIGGRELAKLGIVSPIDIAPLSILGLFEGLMAYSTVVKLADAAAEDILKFSPDSVVLVDSWGFMLRVAQRIRAKAPHIKLIKLVGPQVWATRPGRARTLAQAVDHLICLHAMEAPYYQPYGLPVTVMGNPALGRSERGDGAAFRSAHYLSDASQILAIFPGSRASEIKSVAPAFMDAARRIKSQRPDIKIVFAPAPSVRELFVGSFPDLSDLGLLADEAESTANIMAAADYALACSGTVTSELAVQRTPFLVGYRVGWITWTIGRNFLYKPTHITLLNIAANDTAIVPEFLQADLTGENIAREALAMLADPQRLAAQVEAQNKALVLMGEGSEKAADIAARTIRDVTSATSSVQSRA